MKNIRTLAICILGLGSAAVLVYAFVSMFSTGEAVNAQSNAAAGSNRVVETADAPKAIGPYSQAVIANGFVYTAGQIGIDPKTGKLVEGGIVEQTEQVLTNLEAVLKASGSGLDVVVKATVFLADLNDFAKMNAVYGKRFKTSFPARSTVQAARLPMDAKVEIEVIATLRK